MLSDLRRGRFHRAILGTTIVIVATAGHVDHGKTALIKALTGVDTDTLSEEKKRGLTINLGYAYLETKDGRSLGFIDVPGHHRFINNMIAGVSGIDRALLIIAADDGLMPQTLEHLDVLTVMGISCIDIVITKIDRNTTERCNEVANQARALMADRARLQDPFAFFVSSMTGTGIADLASHLAQATEQRDDVNLDQGFRLSIDRCFHVKGAGVVVTGTASTGSATVGDTLTLLPQGQEIRIRELRSNDLVSDTALAGQRVALCLAGKVNVEDINRGDCLVDATLAHQATRVDVQLSLLTTSPVPLKHLSPAKVYIGAKRIGARVALIDCQSNALAPGQATMAQLILEKPLSTITGERFVLRDDSESINLGGGFVLDPSGPKHGKSKRNRLVWLRALSTGSPDKALAYLLAGDICINWERLAACFNIKPGLSPPLLPDTAIRFDRDDNTWIATKAAIAKTRALLLGAVADAATAEKMFRGIPREHLVASVGRETHRALAEAALQILLNNGTLTVTGGRVSSANSGQSNVGDEHWSAMKSVLDTAGLEVPLISALQSIARLSDLDLKLALKRGSELKLLHRVNANRYALSRTLTAFAEASIHLAADDALSVAAFKDHLDIGRKLAVEILEFFDSINFTQRRGNLRIIVNHKALQHRLAR